MRRLRRASVIFRKCFKTGTGCWSGRHFRRTPASSEALVELLMRRTLFRYCGWLMALGAGFAAAQALPQAAPTQAPPRAWTWEQVKDRLELNNPTLLAGKLNIGELQAQEITAHLRPNPNLALLSDQIDPFPGGPAHGPFAYWLPSATVSYLHERGHKRELRTESAKKATAIGVSQQQDLERNLLFNVRGAFVQI